MNLNLKAAESKIKVGDNTSVFSWRATCPKGKNETVAAGPDGYVCKVEERKDDTTKLSKTVVTYYASGDKSDVVVEFGADGKITELKLNSVSKKNDYIDEKEGKMKKDIELGHITIKADKVNLDDAKKNADTVDAITNDKKMYISIAGILAIVGGLGYAVYSMTSGKDNTASAA